MVMSSLSTVFPINALSLDGIQHNIIVTIANPTHMLEVYRITLTTGSTFSYILRK